MLHHEEEEISRPEFYGEARRSEITGEWELYYPTWRRVLKQLLGFPISGAWLAGILIGMVVLFDLRDNLIDKLSRKVDSGANISNVATGDSARNTSSVAVLQVTTNSRNLAINMANVGHIN